MLCRQSEGVGRGSTLKRGGVECEGVLGTEETKVTKGAREVYGCSGRCEVVE